MPLEIEYVCQVCGKPFNVVDLESGDGTLCPAHQAQADAIEAQSNPKQEPDDERVELNRKGEPYKDGRRGPVTPEGKATVSMNALKHGRYTSHWERFGEKSGTLPVCKQNCSEDQQTWCQAEQTCAIQDDKILRYHKSYTTRDLKYIEEGNIRHAALLDMLFGFKLRKALEDPASVTTEDLYALLNMYKALSKDLPSMEMTRRTQLDYDPEWAKLLEAEIKSGMAEENKRKILDGLQGWRTAKAQAEEDAKADKAIAEITGKTKVDHDEELDEVRRNPFGGKDES